MGSMSSADIIFTAVFSVLVMANLMGNTLVCLVVLRNPAMRTSMNILLVNLAIADMLVAFSILPQYVLKDTFEHPNGTTGDYLCKFVTGGSFLWFGDKSSIFTLVIIAFERFIVVLYPLTERERVSTRILWKLIFACWVLALILNAPLFWVTSFHRSPEYHCTDVWKSQSSAKVYTVICFLILGVVPVGTVVYLYTRVVYTLWHRKVHATSSLSESIFIQDRKKVTKMAIIVTLLFGFLRFPNLALYLLSQFDTEYYNFGETSFIVSVALVALNSTVNPFVYSLHSSKFRKHLKDLFRLKGKADNEHTSLLS